jgi:DNA-binding NarL/FixJ family response regulator
MVAAARRASSATGQAVPRLDATPGPADGGDIRVLIVDDHAALSGALAIAIDAHPGLHCVGTTATIDATVASMRELTPDVVLMDVFLPDGDGIDAIPALQAATPGVRILILTGHADVDLLARAAAAGASGFLPKESPIGSVIGAVRAAGEGQILVDGTTLASILGRLARSSRHGQDPGSDIPRLTRREADVLRLMARGLDPHAIAKELGISLNTCRGYQKSLMAKLGAHSQLEAVVIGTRRGLVARARD